MEAAQGNVLGHCRPLPIYLRAPCGTNGLARPMCCIRHTQTRTEERCEEVARACHAEAMLVDALQSTHRREQKKGARRWHVLTTQRSLHSVLSCCLCSLSCENSRGCSNKGLGGPIIIITNDCWGLEAPPRPSEASLRPGPRWPNDHYYQWFLARPA